MSSDVARLRGDLEFIAGMLHEVVVAQGRHDLFHLCEAWEVVKQYHRPNDEADHPEGSGSVPPVADDEILSLWRTVRPSPDQNKAMTYVKWKDGIDCDYPAHELRRLVELAMADGFKMAQRLT